MEGYGRFLFVTYGWFLFVYLFLFTKEKGASEASPLVQASKRQKAFASCLLVLLPICQKQQATHVARAPTDDQDSDLEATR